MKRFSWDLGYYCNFKCEYCFFTAAGWEHLKGSQGEPRSPDVIEKAWSAICEAYGPCYLYISGGEPFLYPELIEILCRLSKYHKIQITTNLSQPINDFAAKITPSSIELNSTFHPFFIDISSFTQRVLKLRSAGFSCSVCYLAYPGQLREMLHYKAYFEGHGIDMTPVIYWGTYKGKDYPRNYTEGEREFFRFVAQWKPDGKNINMAFPVVDASADGEQTSGLKSHISKGDTCGAGCDYANVSVDGTVHPCGQLQELRLGNIYEGSVKLFSEPFVCTADFCRCGERNYTEQGRE